MKNKKYLVLFLVVTLLLCGITPVQALEANRNKNELYEVHTIARNAPSFFVPTSDWTNVTIRKTTPLYDLNDEIIAYCVDIQNADTGKNAYIVINADETGTPVLQYAPDATSPYYDIGNSRALYLAPGVYHAIDGDTIVDLTTEEKIAKSSLTIAEKTEVKSNSSVSAETLARNEYVRAVYLSGSSQRSYDTREKILNGVPNWQWNSGCVATAIGMQLANIYPGLNNQNIIPALHARLVNAQGQAMPKDTAQGVLSFLASYSLQTPTYCNFNSYDSVGNPYTGISRNSYSVYKAEINAGRAVAVYSREATIVTGGYPNGWRTAHMITGIGYSYSVSGYDQHIVAYTTAVSDGRVYINIDTELGRFAWFIIRP